MEGGGGAAVCGGDWGSVVVVGGEGLSVGWCEGGPLCPFGTRGWVKVFMGCVRDLTGVMACSSGMADSETGAWREGEGEKVSAVVVAEEVGVKLSGKGWFAVWRC